MTMTGGWTDWSDKLTDAEGLAKMQALIETEGLKEQAAAQPWILQGSSTPRAFETWNAISYASRSQVVAGVNYEHRIVVALTEPIEEKDGWTREYITLNVRVFEPLSGEAQIGMADPVMPLWEFTPKGES